MKKAVRVLHVWQGRSYRFYKKACLGSDTVPRRIQVVQLWLVFLTSLCLISCTASVIFISVIETLKLD